MKKLLAAVSAAGLLGAAGFVAWSVLTRPDDTALVNATASSFDLQTGPAPAPASAAPRADELRDAVASPVSPRPIALAEMVPAAPRTPMPSPPPPPITSRLVNAVRSARVFTGFLSSPARAMASGSALASPRALRAFLADRGAVNRFLDSAMVRVVLNSPAAAKAVIGSSLVVRAFLSSPAMRDKKAVADLLSSPMVRKMLDCPGVQAALGDQSVVSRLATDPAMGEFLAQNPETLKAIAGAAPELARAISR